MEKIEITTSHNIVVRFELASLMQRILAFFIDIFILCIFSGIVAIVGSEVLYWLIIFPVVAFYHLAFEIFYQGRSIGKKLLKIRVVSLEGRTAKLNDYLVRWVFRLIEVVPALGSIAIIFIVSSEKNQRIGDMLANTTVVKERNENEVQLKSIESIEVGEDIKYPSIIQFSDSDMLLVKQAINRYMNNPHKNNKEVLDELCIRISDKLNVDTKGMKKVDFLNKVLYEYVILTR